MTNLDKRFVPVALMGVIIMVGLMALLLSGCSSNPKDDPNIVDCGDGYYRPTKVQCP
jgi:PBP1b-binding outer membrane lipoprotein LpoB